MLFTGIQGTQTKCVCRDNDHWFTKHRNNWHGNQCNTKLQIPYSHDVWNWVWFLCCTGFHISISTCNLFLCFVNQLSIPLHVYLLSVLCLSIPVNSIPTSLSFFWCRRGRLTLGRGPHGWLCATWTTGNSVCCTSCKFMSVYYIATFEMYWHIYQCCL